MDACFADVIVALQACLLVSCSVSSGHQKLMSFLCPFFRLPATE